MEHLEKHPNWFVDFQPMKYLFLGSFPPDQSKHSFPFYYPNKQNRFWKVISMIANSPLLMPLLDKEKAVQERISLMKMMHFGIHDVAQEIVRTNNSSLDSKIRITQYNDIVRIIEDHPELEKIFLLGFSSKNSAAVAFLEYLKKEKISAKFPLDFQPKAENTFSIFIKNRMIVCVILNSTSSASTITLEQLKTQFQKYLK